MGVAIAGANVPDSKLLEQTIEAIVVERPDPEKVEQHLCLDKGYDNSTSDAVVSKQGYVSHTSRIRPKGDGGADAGSGKPRRWVVERTHAWLSKCRAILVRYDKRSTNYLGLIQLACALLWFRRIHALVGT